MLITGIVFENPVWLSTVAVSYVCVTITGNDVTYTFPAGSGNFVRLKVTGTSASIE